MKKSILILGATSDIGKALAKRYAAEGWGIFLAGRDRDQLDRLASDIKIRYNVPADAHYFDALAYDSHKDFWKNLQDLPSVTVSVFGYLGEQETAEEDWEMCQRILDTNYTAAVSILNLVSNSYLARGQGVIIGISSVAGDRGRSSNYLYGSSKAAFTAYLSGLRARMFAKNVHVMTVKPGFVMTKMTACMDLPPLLTAKPGDVANVIFKAMKKKKNVIYVEGKWRWIMLIIKLIPETIFKRLKF